MESEQRNQDSALMQKVLAVLQSFLSDCFCCKYSTKKGRFSRAARLFAATCYWDLKDASVYCQKAQCDSLYKC